MQKFQQYFLTIGQKIIDMNISYDNSDELKPAYKTIFDLSNIKTNEKSNLTITESASKCISSYYQNLCYTYLEGKKFSEIDDSLLTQDIIINQMNIFSECCKTLNDMAKYKINITGNKVTFSIETNFEPSKDLENSESKDQQNYDAISL